VRSLARWSSRLLVVGEQGALYLAIGLQDGVAGLAGNTSEEPFSHSYGPWMWWRELYLYQDSAAGGGHLSTARLELDIRTKRRFDATDILVACVTNSPQGGVDVPLMGAAFGIRVLYKDN
jgi:hypothetical protein